MNLSIASRVLCLSLILLSAPNPAQANSTELLSELAEQSLAPTLDSNGPLLFSPSGNVLYAGSTTEPKLNRFTVAADGSLSLTNETRLNNLGATLTSTSALLTNTAGTVLYTAGDHQIAVLARNTTTSNLALTTTLVVDPTLTIRDLALSNDGRHLYVVSNNYSGTTEQGTSSLHRYEVNPADGTLTLAATRAEPNSSTPLSSITIPSAADLAFVGRRSILEVSRRDSNSGALTLLRSHSGIGDVTATAAGDWLFTAEYQALGVYRVDLQTGQLTLTQQFRSGLPPTPANTLRAASEIALNAAEDRLITTGYGPVGWRPIPSVSGPVYGRLEIFSTDVFVRDPTSGNLRYDGTGLRSGSQLARHPTEDWFYTLIASVSSPNQPGMTIPILAQQGLQPTAPGTTIVAAVLPTSRTEGDRLNRTEPITAFATVLNTGSTDAVDCRGGLVRESLEGLNFSLTRADPVSNEPLAANGGVFNVPAGGATQLVLLLSTQTPAAIPITRVPELLDVRFFCHNADMTDRVTGVTTFAFASDPEPLPDLLTATASPDQPGVVSLPGTTGQSFFTVATLNLGASGRITATGAVELAGAIDGAEALANPPAVRMLICETDPATSQCKAPFAASVARTIDANEVATYTVLIDGLGTEIAFRPDINRVFVLLKDSDGNLRGGSSVAVETQ